MRIILFLFLNIFFYGIHSTSEEWTWVSGNDTDYVNGVYGTKGESSINNYPGGREESVSWFDSSNKKLWLFGGHGYPSSNYGYLNDLWSFSIKTNEWTWVSGNDSEEVYGVYGTKGEPSINNYPGAREGSISWFDSSNKKLWLFGGQGLTTDDYGRLNDLWSFSIETNEWTWVSGSNITDKIGNYGTKGEPSINNYPGARDGSISWFDSSNKKLWLFGGNGYSALDYGYLNDLWSFSIETNEWTWVSGSNTDYAPGNYGTKGEPSINNYPGGRVSSISWFDSSNKKLWLFGGNGVANDSDAFGLLNDLWSFSIETNEWTWVSGNNTVNVNGVYGTKGEPSINNYPGGRESSISWFDSSENTFWLFGGSNFFFTKAREFILDASDFGRFNDLWSFSIETNEWTWVSGNNTVDAFGVYGTKGESSINNYPGGREMCISWFDSSENTIWLFGGYGYPKDNIIDDLNDLWSYKLRDNIPVSEPEEEKEPSGNTSGSGNILNGILIELSIIIMCFIIF